MTPADDPGGCGRWRDRPVLRIGSPRWTPRSWSGPTGRFDVCARGQSHGFRAPADTAEWSAEQVLAHIAANDRLLLATTAAVLGGTVPQGRPAYDNSAVSYT